MKFTKNTYESDATYTLDDVQNYWLYHRQLRMWLLEDKSAESWFEENWHGDRPFHNSFACMYSIMVQLTAAKFIIDPSLCMDCREREQALRIRSCYCPMKLHADDICNICPLANAAIVARNADTFDDLVESLMCEHAELNLYEAHEIAEDVGDFDCKYALIDLEETLLELKEYSTRYKTVCPGSSRSYIFDYGHYNADGKIFERFLDTLPNTSWDYETHTFYSVHDVDGSTDSNVLEKFSGYYGYQRKMSEFLNDGHYIVDDLVRLGYKHVFTEDEDFTSLEKWWKNQKEV